MVRKGQAAMEYLMTYGWAILVIVIVLAALLYLGVFNLGERVPDQCRFKVGILCTSAKISVTTGSEAISLKLQNTLGSKITICQVACAETSVDTGDMVTGGPGGAAITVQNCDGTAGRVSIASGQAGTTSSAAGAMQVAVPAGGCYANEGGVTTNAAFVPGYKLRGKVYLWYSETGDGNVAGTRARVTVGDLQTTLQP